MTTPPHPPNTPWRLYRDEAIGETRLVLADAEQRPVRLWVERWSRPEHDPRLSAAYAGRVTSIATHLGGAFVSLGSSGDGFLPFKRGATPKGLHEGASVRVDIAAEARGDKPPRLRRLPGVTDAAPGLLGAAPSAVEQAQKLLAATGSETTAAPIAGADARAMADLACEMAMENRIALPDGGDVSVEATRGFLAADVDSGPRAGTGGADRFASRLNAQAATTLLRRLAVRATGGLVVVDCLTQRDAAPLRKTLQDAGKALQLPLTLDAITPQSVAVFTLAHTRRPVDQILLDEQGRASHETLALSALRAVEREARARPAPGFVVELPPGPAAWLMEDPIGWRDALLERLGLSVEITAAETQRREHIHIRPA